MAQSVRYLDLEEHIEGILRCAGIEYRKGNLRSIEITAEGSHGTSLKISEFERDVLDAKIGFRETEIWVDTK